MSSSVSCKLQIINGGGRTHDKLHQPLNTQWMENVLGGTLKDNELGSIFLNGCPHRTCSYSEGVKQPKRNTQRQGKHILSNVKLFAHMKLINYKFIFSQKKFDVWFSGCLQREIRGSGLRGVFGARINFIGLVATLPVRSSSSIANLCIIQKCDP